MATLNPPSNIYGVTANQPKPLSAHELHMAHLNHLAQTGATQQQINQANNYNKAQTNKSLAIPGNTGVVNPTIPSIPTPTQTNVNSGVVPPTQQAMPTYKSQDPFQFNYNYLNYDTAKNQAEQQFNPLYEQSVNAVKAQQYQNNLDSGQSAAVRGLAHSGLAQDALTKIAIATQGQISGLNAQKMSDVAKMAQDLVSRDQSRGDALRSQMFNEYASNRDFGYNQYRDNVGDTRYANDTAYNHYRDQVGDNQWQTQFDYNKGRDTIGDQRYADETAYNRNRDTLGDQYRDKRDSINDARYTDETTYNRSQDALNRKDSNYWNQIAQNNNTRDYNRSVLESDRNWNQMSPADKMKMAAEFYYSQKGKKASGGGGGGRSSSSSFSGGLTQKGSQQLNIDPNILMAYYNSMLNSKAGNANVPYSRDPNSAYMRKMQDIANG
jgi:hypothetical protein